MDLSTASNQARVLLNAFKGLQHLESIIDAGSKAQTLERECNERTAVVLAQEASAVAARDRALAEAEAITVKAKAEADEIAGKAHAVLISAKADADNLLASAQGNAQATVKRADAKVASLEAEAATLAEAIKAKAAECAALDKRISDNRAILRKHAEV